MGRPFLLLQSPFAVAQEMGASPNSPTVTPLLCGLDFVPGQLQNPLLKLLIPLDGLGSHSQCMDSGQAL